MIRGRRIFGLILLLTFACLGLGVWQCDADNDCHADASPDNSHCVVHCSCHLAALPAILSKATRPGTFVLCLPYEQRLNVPLFADSIFQPPRV